MGRTALNVSGSVTAGTLDQPGAGRKPTWRGFNSDADLTVDSERHAA